jgi:hypothetical protein
VSGDCDAAQLRSTLLPNAPKVALVWRGAERLRRRLKAGGGRASAIMKEEEEGSQGAGTPLELLASWIECQDKFLNALCFISSVPDSQDFAAVQVV